MTKIFSEFRNGFFLFPLLVFSGCFFGVWTIGPSHAQRAAQLRTEKRYDEAIAEYRIHMEERRRDSHRPPEENPSFYELLIGDTYAEAGRTEEAEAAYTRAVDEGVHVELVNFKLRHLAQALEEKGKLQEAIDFLKKYRDRDPVMFDYDIDRLHKKIVAQEESQELR